MCGCPSLDAGTYTFDQSMMTCTLCATGLHAHTDKYTAAMIIKSLRLRVVVAALNQPKLSHAALKVFKRINPVIHRSRSCSSVRERSEIVECLGATM
jgi:hypothetical protein